MATWEECNQEIEPIVPPASESTLDKLLGAIGYAEQEVTIGGDTYTILVKVDESE